jgi:hypothetical protein
MWQCPKRRSKVDDSFDVCWSCGTTPDGLEDPDFVTADEADPIADEKIPEGTPLDDPFADFEEFHAMAQLLDQLEPANEGSLSGAASITSHTRSSGDAAGIQTRGPGALLSTRSADCAQW